MILLFIIENQLAGIRFMYLIVFVVLDISAIKLAAWPETSQDHSNSHLLANMEGWECDYTESWGLEEQEPVQKNYSCRNPIAEKLLCKCLDEFPLNDSLASILIQIEI